MKKIAIKYLLEEQQRTLVKVNKKINNKKIEDLKEYFENKFCPITDCVIMIDKNTSKIKQIYITKKKQIIEEDLVS